MSPSFKDFVAKYAQFFDYLKTQEPNSYAQVQAIRGSLLDAGEFTRDVAGKLDQDIGELQRRCENTDAATRATVDDIRQGTDKALGEIRQELILLRRDLDELAARVAEDAHRHGLETRQTLDALLARVQQLETAPARVAASPAGSGGGAPAPGPGTTPPEKPDAPVVTNAPKPIGTPQPDSPEAPASFLLVGISGNSLRIELPLTARRFKQHNGRLILGASAAHANIQINDASVAARHADMCIRSGRLFLKDLGDRAGTKVNGQRLSPHVEHPVDVGDLITLGRLHLRIRKLEATVTPAGRPA